MIKPWCFVLRCWDVSRIKCANRILEAIWNYFSTCLCLRRSLRRRKLRGTSRRGHDKLFRGHKSVSEILPDVVSDVCWQVWSIRGGDWLFKGFERSPASSLDSSAMQGQVVTDENPWCLEVSTLPKKSSSERRSRDSQFSLGLEFPQLGFLNGAVFTCTWGILWMLG